jgi:hypothetical protein
VGHSGANQDFIDENLGTLEGRTGTSIIRSPLFIKRTPPINAYLH